MYLGFIYELRPIDDHIRALKREREEYVNPRALHLHVLLLLYRQVYGLMLLDLSLYVDLPLVIGVRIGYNGLHSDITTTFTRTSLRRHLMT